MKILHSTLIVAFALTGCNRPSNFFYLQPDPQQQQNQKPTNPGCPVQTENVLIIDLKSGWWEGDGGTTFNSIESSISSQCAKFNIEYGHMTTVEDEDGEASAFPSKPFSTYNEIWVLSGAETDPEDLRLESSTFQRFLNGVTSSTANLFLGSGFGTNYHIDAITSALGLGSVVNPGAGNDLVFLNGNGSDVITAVSQISVSAASSPLFKNVSSLADLVNVNGSNMTPDILLMNSMLSPLLTNNAGQTEIASATVANRQVIIDVDLPRMYMVLNNDQNARSYIINMVMTLQQ